MSKTIELSGNKFEIGEQKIKKIQEYKIGDTVKVLDTKYSNAEISDGIIIDFLDFKKLPTIRVAIVDHQYSDFDIKFVSINSKTENVEIMPISPDELKIDLDTMNEIFSEKIAESKRKTTALEHKRAFFNRFFGKKESEIKEHID